MDTVITAAKAQVKKDNTVLYVVYAAAAYFGLQYLLKPKRAAAMVVPSPAHEVVVNDTPSTYPVPQPANIGKQVPATTAYMGESFPLRKGMRGQRIKILQQKLGITADGMFGSGTEAALLQQYRMRTVSEVQYRQILQVAKTATPTVSTRTASTTVLKKGSKGADVFRLQQWLGFKDKRIARRGEPVADGDFGTQTQTALLQKTGRVWISITSLNEYIQKARTAR